MTAHGRLPVVCVPEVDERLSSWIVRLASIYAMTGPELVAELGLPGRDVADLEWRLSEGEGALIASRTGISAAAIQAMTFRDMAPDARMMIARMARYPCPSCPTDVHRKSAALPWIFRCLVHDVEVCSAAGASLSETFTTDCASALRDQAGQGAAVLDAWARGDTHGDPGAPEMLAVLTVRHRRASPPTVAEQPRITLQARRDYHAFLTAPIIRQALVIIVPECQSASNRDPLSASNIDPSGAKLARRCVVPI